MKKLIGILLVLLPSSIYCQTIGMCGGSESHEDYYKFIFQINETHVVVKATPNYVLRLEEHFKVACRGEYYRVLAYCTILDSIPFVHDVRCKNCEGTADEWILKKILHTTKFEVVDGSGHLPKGRFDGILHFTVTPLEKR